MDTELELDLDDTVEELTQEQIIELELNEICFDISSDRCVDVFVDSKYKDDNESN